MKIKLRINRESLREIIMKDDCVELDLDVSNINHEKYYHVVDVEDVESSWSVGVFCGSLGYFTKLNRFFQP